jgi:hypothetical protein
VSGVAKVRVAAGGWPASGRPSTSNSEAGQPVGKAFVNAIVNDGTGTAVRRRLVSLTAIRDAGLPGNTGPFNLPVTHRLAPPQSAVTDERTDPAPSTPAATAMPAPTKAAAASTLAVARGVQFLDSRLRTLSRRRIHRVSSRNTGCSCRNGRTYFRVMRRSGDRYFKPTRSGTARLGRQIDQAVAHRHRDRVRAVASAQLLECVAMVGPHGRH